MTQTSYDKVKLVNLVDRKCNLISKGKVKTAAVSFWHLIVTLQLEVFATAKIAKFCSVVVTGMHEAQLTQCHFQTKQLFLFVNLNLLQIL